MPNSRETDRQIYRDRQTETEIERQRVEFILFRERRLLPKSL